VCLSGAAPRTEELKVTPKSVTHKERIQKKKDRDNAAQTALLTTAIRKSQVLILSQQRDVCKSAAGAHYRDSAHYGVASVSRIDKIIGLFCKRAL